MWQFDDDVANRFQAEAENNIPDYNRVINLCIDVANKEFTHVSKVVDVGSALGNTLNEFIKAGYTNVIGVESSTNMIAKSLHKDKVLLSDKFPNIAVDIVLANWTLHFVNEREEYIRSVYKNLNDNGVFILTDKTTQSESIKELYYDFKRSNGVTEEYIASKEIQLEGVLVTYPAWWYFDMLQLAGFKDVQVLNAKYGFVTYYCKK
jgi:SAM-dependent methyltransferase